MKCQRISGFGFRRRVARGWLLALPILAGAAAAARGQDPATMISNNIPRRNMAQAVMTWEARTDFKGAGVNDNVQVTEWSTYAAAPLVMKPTWKLFAVVSLRLDRMKFSVPEVDDLDAYVISVPVRLQVPWREKWDFLVAPAPGIYSDLKRITAEDFRMAGMAMANYAWSPTLRVAMGLAYAPIFGSASVFPAVGATWTPRAEWQVALMFPRPAVTYAPTRWYRFMADLTPAGDQWNVAAQVDGAERECDLHFKGYRTGVGGEVDLTEHINVMLRGGWVFGRNYDLQYEGDSIRENGVENTWFMTAAIGIR